MEAEPKELKSPRRHFKIIALAVGSIFTLLLIVTSIGFYQYKNLLEPVNTEQSSSSILVEVPKGSSTTSVASLLNEKGLIKNASVFKLYFRLKELDGQLKPGEYTLNSGMSVPQLADKLIQGSVVYYSFTIPEGYNTKQIADVLEKKGYVDREKFMDLVSNGEFKYDFLKEIPASEQRLEGYLFPDTYKITKDTNEEQIIEMMLSRFNSEISPDFKEKAKTLGMSLHEAVTLASVIEREAVKDAERSRVSAVFHNRLKKGIKLESCATIQYALGEQKTRLLYKDLQVESSYNTYKYTNLPPGPIASPGGPSLEAAVNPEKDVDYLFFVVSENGEHVFSNTLREHNKAKAKYVQRFKTP